MTAKTMADVLAEHQDCTAGQNLGYYRTREWEQETTR
jgi:hypothetical protein